MFELKVSLYKLRFEYYKMQRDRALDKAKDHLFDDDITEYKKCMSRALHYIKKIEKVTIEAEQFIYG